MVQINLLPDARKERLRDSNNRQLAISVAVTSITVSVVGLVLLVIITQAQNIQKSMLTTSIENKRQQITQDIPNAQAIATLQTHSDSLSQLYGSQARLSKFFSVLGKVSNNDVSIASVGLDATNKLSVAGTARSYAAASKLAEAMEASNVTLGENASPTNTPDFSNVLLNALSGEQGKISFTITAQVAGGVIRGN